MSSGVSQAQGVTATAGIIIQANVSPSMSATGNQQALTGAIQTVNAVGAGTVTIPSFSSPMTIDRPIVPMSGVKILGSGYVQTPLSAGPPTSGSIFQGDGTFPLFALNSMMEFTTALIAATAATVTNWTLGNGTYRTKFSDGSIRFVTITGTAAAWLGSAVTATKWAYYEKETAYASYNATLDAMVVGFGIEGVGGLACSDFFRFGTRNQSSLAYSTLKNLFVSGHTVGWGFYLENSILCFTPHTSWNIYENVGLGNAVDSGGGIYIGGSLGAQQNPGNSKFDGLFVQNPAAGNKNRRGIVVQARSSIIGASRVHSGLNDIIIANPQCNQSTSTTVVSDSSVIAGQYAASAMTLALTFTGAPSGARNGTLNANWPATPGTGKYLVVFSNNDERVVNCTTGSAAVDWYDDYRGAVATVTTSATAHSGIPVANSALYGLEMPIAHIGSDTASMRKYQTYFVTSIIDPTHIMVSNFQGGTKIALTAVDSLTLRFYGWPNLEISGIASGIDNTQQQTSGTNSVQSISVTGIDLEQAATTTIVAQNAAINDLVENIIGSTGTQGINNANTITARNITGRHKISGTYDFDLSVSAYRFVFDKPVMDMSMSRPWIQNFCTPIGEWINGSAGSLLTGRGGSRQANGVSNQIAIFGDANVMPSTTVAALPSAAETGQGGQYMVTDATNAAGTGLGTAPTGGGAVKRMVYSDGTNWLLL